MSKPNDIPRDIWDETQRLCLYHGINVGGMSIARALLAERDRCLRVVAEQRCERGTPWDHALVAAMNAIKPGSAVWEPKP